VRLADGQLLTAEAVVVATGVRSNTWLARQAGLEVNRGIIVDNHLTTSDPDVLAAGDVCEHNGTVYGLWGASQYQGGIAGMNAAGKKTAFAGIPRSSTLKVMGLDLVSVGEFEPRDGSYRVIAAETAETYKLFLFRDNRLLGTILLGDTSAGGAARKVIESGGDCSAVLHGAPNADDICARLTD
jgi:nitrite reductase (NADH) large subunit